MVQDPVEDNKRRIKDLSILCFIKNFRIFVYDCSKIILSLRKKKEFKLVLILTFDESIRGGMVTGNDHSVLTGDDEDWMT